MTPDQARKHFRTIAAIARACGIKGSSVSEWFAAGEIPIDRQCQLEVVTGGRLVADRASLNMVTSQQHVA